MDERTTLAAPLGTVAGKPETPMETTFLNHRDVLNELEENICRLLERLRPVSHGMPEGKDMPGRNHSGSSALATALHDSTDRLALLNGQVLKAIDSLEI